MLVIRPVALDDLEPLLELATLTGFGLTTLPRDRELLSKRIRKSLRSFESMGDLREGENYLFVLEDQGGRDSPHVVGTCGIIARVGGFDPFYSYRIETSIHESEFLGVRKEIPVLHSVAEHSGPSEVCSLFLKPEYRKDNNGRLLSLSRFLFMAEHLSAFEPMVMAEIRGVIDDRGKSAFWDAVGKHFFDIEFPKADYLSLINKRFIADLMPTHPIYTPLLPEAAQKVIGQPHEQSRPALKLLEAEGFRFGGMVDIFEAGPTLTCPLMQIRAIRESKPAVVAEIGEVAGGEEVLIANTSANYRCCKGIVQLVAGVPYAGVAVAAVDDLPMVRTNGRPGGRGEAGGRRGADETARGLEQESSAPVSAGAQSKTPDPFGGAAGVGIPSTGPVPLAQAATAPAPHLAAGAVPHGGASVDDGSAMKTAAAGVALPVTTTTTATVAAPIDTQPVRISVECARALRVARGDRLRYVEMRPARKQW